MKIILLVLVAVFLQIGAAFPHGHQKFHVKKDYTTEIVTEFATVTVPEYVVWVDHDGKAVSTETRMAGIQSSTPTGTVVSIPQTQLHATPTPAIFSPSSTIEIPSFSSNAEVKTTAPPTPVVGPISTRIVSTTTEAPPPPSITTVVSTPVTTSKSMEASTSASQEGSRVEPGKPNQGSDSNQGVSQNTGQQEVGGYGIAYDILKGAYPGTCKSAQDVQNDFVGFKNAGHTIVRIYDITCNQVQLVTQYAAASGMKVFAGLGDLHNLDANLNSIVSQAGSNLAAIDTIGIGNELVNDGLATVGAVVAALDQARSTLGGLGYHGSIVTVDTFTAHDTHPDLCGHSDYCAANCHAFFDSDITAAGAGAYVQGQKQGVMNVNSGKRTVITESGWPYQGNANGNAIPSPDDQVTAIASLRAAFPAGDLIFFEDFDATYKTPGALGVEQFFGIYGH